MSRRPRHARTVPELPEGVRFIGNNILDAVGGPSDAVLKKDSCVYGQFLAALERGDLAQARHIVDLAVSEAWSHGNVASTFPTARARRRARRRLAREEGTD
jgi:hypothetical protein